MLRTVMPAPLVDTLELTLDADGRAPRLAFVTALWQWHRSESIGFLAGDELVAAAFLYPLPPSRPGEDYRALAFICAPAAARHMLAIIRFARLTFSRLRHDPNVRICATARTATGARLAALIGMCPIGKLGRIQVFEWQGQNP